MHWTLQLLQKLDSPGRAWKTNPQHRGAKWAHQCSKVFKSVYEVDTPYNGVFFNFQRDSDPHCVMGELWAQGNKPVTTRKTLDVIPHLARSNSWGQSWVVVAQCYREGEWRSGSWMGAEFEFEMMERLWARWRVWLHNTRMYLKPLSHKVSCMGRSNEHSM